MKPYLTSLTILSLALMSLVTYSFTTAQWVNPPASPPNNNVPAPIHVGATYQFKAGELGSVLMRSGRYCNIFGTQCYIPGTPGVPTTIEDNVVITGQLQTNNGLVVNGQLQANNNVQINGSLNVTGGITGGSTGVTLNQLGGGQQLYRCPNIQPSGNEGCYSGCVGQIGTAATCRQYVQSGGACRPASQSIVHSCTPVN